jgi:hypothetical protein
VMHDASHSCQVGARSGESPRGNTGPQPGSGRSPQQHGYMQGSMTTATAGRQLHDG